MSMSGVRTGMVVTAVVLRPILQDHHRALTAWPVAAAGTTARGSAGYRIVTSTIRTAVTATTASALSFRYYNYNP